MKTATERRPGVIVLAALWFGAAVSLAEMETGALLSSLGFWRGMAANLGGHALGAVLFFMAAWISLSRGKAAMAASDGAFGRGGPGLFGLLNTIQLIGWTAVMIVVGARSLAGFLPEGAVPETVVRLALGFVVAAWALAGPRRIGKANLVVSALLGLLCVVLSVRIFLPLFKSGGALAAAASGGDGASFGSAFELAIIMPLSWLPLVGDYAVEAKGKPLSLALWSALAYLVGSVWMYAIGLGGQLVAGTTDPVALLGGPLALAALLIVLFSTVTTAFLDLRSAGISLRAAAPGVGEDLASVGVAILSILLALIAPISRYQDFLYLIGSAFAPLYGVLITEYLYARRGAEKQKRPMSAVLSAFAAWAAGLVFYHAALRGFLPLGASPLGTSVPAMAASAVIYLALLQGGELWRRRSSSKA